MRDIKLGAWSVVPAARPQLPAKKMKKRLDIYD